ncbi:TcaA NTF2-like domain-containing protein [Paenibacillus agri]|uniref:TcaA protein NTF2-like domain-containing protein n=1 Tax=Paenibacillus agri TaxID=2744309 RepID=A0A850ETM9_9BACL|nr:hypothetical protein [Paenibacillus agri]NUU63049.1 hypothetical protein [Paenibacillus agri]
MKLLPLTLLISLLLLSGCGQKNASAPAPSPEVTEAPIQTKAPKPASTISPSPDARTADSTVPEHYRKDGYDGLLIDINNLETTRDVFDHQYLVFDLILHNGTNKSLAVSASQFILLTVNKELLEYDPTAETVEPADNQTTTVLSGGQRNLRVGFVVKPEEVSELFFYDGSEPIYQITALQSVFSNNVIAPNDTLASTEESSFIEGGNAKSDDFIFQDNYLGYLNSLIEAINTGDFSLVEIHLLYDSDLYAQQQKLVQTLSEMGTREEMTDYEIQSTSYDEDSSTLTMKVREQIKVIAADGTVKATDSSWMYTALQVDQGVFQFSSIAKAE